MPWRNEENCRSCDERIVWARTAFGGKPIRINTTPANHGNIIIEANDVNERLMAIVLPPGDERIEAETTYTAHVCPGVGKSHV